MSLKQALIIHLTARCFPSRLIMLKTARKAIKAYQNNDYEKAIELPKDVNFRGSNIAPASEIVKHLRLEDFL